jgi:hypothetical protein
MYVDVAIMYFDVSIHYIHRTLCIHYIHYIHYAYIMHKYGIHYIHWVVSFNRGVPLLTDLGGFDQIYASGVRPQITDSEFFGRKTSKSVIGGVTPDNGL